MTNKNDLKTTKRDEKLAGNGPFYKRQVMLKLLYLMVLTTIISSSSALDFMGKERWFYTLSFA